jgi:hypothetical protein
MRAVPQRSAAPRGMSNHRILQTKAKPATLAINKPGDAFEQQADRIAEQVMRMPQPVVPMAAAHAPAVRRRASHQAAPETAPPTVHNVLRSPGRPLDAATRDFMEPRFGQNFGPVRVHSDGEAAAAASAVHARAYTIGHEIMFGADEYPPH